MIKVFIEYKVKEASKEEYLEAMDAYVGQFVDHRIQNYRFYEGADQPSLFVEMFDVASMELYEEIKQLRSEQETPIEKYIQGGREKIHMWAFKEIALCGKNC